ncbi:TPA: tail fiber assembly protein [Klebsiella oxytoca]|nr:tail fiber assembly protein [Klebsiella michiganensis]HAT3671810.1 tail fiber assembly protein [Klebsiella oxytoca]
MSTFSFSDTDQALWLYHFDSTGVYIGSGLALIPAGTGLPAKTTIAPCQPSDGFTGVWDGDAWNYVEDKRGMRYWNQYGKGSVIVSINETPPENAIFIEPPQKEEGYVLLFEDDVWLKIKDLTGQKYYTELGDENVIPSPYFVLPDGATLVPPPESKAGFATVWGETRWTYVEDFRGKTAYRKDTGTPVIVIDVGPLSDELTFAAPVTKFDEWDGEQWVTNDENLKKSLIASAEQYKRDLRNEADEEIAVLSSAVKYGLATDTEKEMLEKWEIYRIELVRVDTSLAPDITWPAKP